MSNDCYCHWFCRKNNTKIDRRKILKREEVFKHPLEPFMKLMKNVPMLQIQTSKHEELKPYKITNSVSSDPLGVVLDGNDPLSMFQNSKYASSEYDNDWDSGDVPNEGKYKGLELWSVKKESILSQFGSQEMLMMMKCFSLQEKVRSIPKGKTERKDELEEGIVFEINDMLPSDFHHKMESFHSEIIKAWNEDQRVKALKIVIQCCKLLSDTSACSFYPNKYIYVTDMLDTFGDLVYIRLKTKCEQLWKSNIYNKNLKEFPDNFTSEIVPEVAKETCFNWFYKIASIRELIPRLYVEAAFLHSYSFIKTGEKGNILSRLQRMVRGVGDPLVNLYLRCYLCRVGVQFGVDGYSFFTENFHEFMEIYQSIFNKKIPLLKDVAVSKYLESFAPPLEWLVQGMIADDENSQCLLFDFFFKMKNNTLLLSVMFNSFKNSFILTKASVIINWIMSSDFNHVPAYQLLKLFANCYERHLKEHRDVIPVSILDAVWFLIYEIKIGVQYIICVEQWIPLSINNLPPNRVDFILNDMIKHILEDHSLEKHNSQMENIVRNLTNCIDDFMSLLIAQHFLSFINLFRNESVKVAICKIIMEASVQRSDETLVNDAVVLNNLMVIARILHDSINALTVEDEKRQIGFLLSNFVRRIDFGRDFEQQLEFYVEARGAFFNLDTVHITLIYCVNKLSFETLKVVKGRHTAKTSAFVRACSAFCFITVPSISSSLQRLQLYILSSQVALANQCLGQAEACFKAILDTIPEFPKHIDGSTSEKRSELILASYLKELFSIILVVPDNPKDNMLHLFRDLINSLSSYSWEESTTMKPTLYMYALHALSTAFQDEYPYHFFNVDSNDVLYASDLNFRVEINNLCTDVLTEILTELQALGLTEQTTKQGQLSYELFICVLLRGDMLKFEMAKLSIHLWNLANKNVVDKSIAINVVQYCIMGSALNSSYREVFSKLLTKLK